MPDHDDYRAIQRDIATRRQDLAATLDALQAKVRERVDVRARARVAIARAEQHSREHPGQFAGVAALVFGLGVALGYRLRW